MLIDKLVRQVRDLELDLRGKTVLTEAASGAYIVTPVLAAIAGAKVFAANQYFTAVNGVVQHKVFFRRIIRIVPPVAEQVVAKANTFCGF